MVLNNVFTTNLSILKDMVGVISENRGIMPKNLSRVLNRVIIRFDVSEISPQEALSIKNIASDYTLCKGFTKNGKAHALISNVGIPISQETDYYVNEIEKLCEDKVCSTAVLPLACTNIEISASFIGAGILKLLGGFMFTDVFYDVNPETGKEKERTTEEVENILAQKFHELVYQNLFNTLTSRDFITDAWIEDSCYRYINPEKDTFVISQIFNNEGTRVTFLDGKRGELDFNMRKIVSEAKSTNTHTFIEIGCSTSAYFFYLYSLYANKNVVSDYSDVCALLSKHDKSGKDIPRSARIVYAPIDNFIELQKANVESEDYQEILKAETAFHNNLQNIISEEDTVKDDMAASQDKPVNTNILAKTLLMPGNTKMMFTLVLPVEMGTTADILMCLDLAGESQIASDTKEYDILISEMLMIENIINRYIEDMDDAEE